MSKSDDKFLEEYLLSKTREELYGYLKDILKCVDMNLMISESDDYRTLSNMIMRLTTKLPESAKSVLIVRVFEKNTLKRTSEILTGMRYLDPPERKFTIYMVSGTVSKSLRMIRKKYHKEIELSKITQSIE